MNGDPGHSTWQVPRAQLIFTVTVIITIPFSVVTNVSEACCKQGRPGTGTWGTGVSSVSKRGSSRSLEKGPKFSQMSAHHRPLLEIPTTAPLTNTMPHGPKRQRDQPEAPFPRPQGGKKTIPPSCSSEDKMRRLEQTACHRAQHIVGAQ